MQWVDATVPVTRIEMVLTVQPVLEVQPRMVRIRTTEGKGASQRVTISTHGGEAFAITKVTASKPFLQTSLSGEGASRQLTITLAADAPTGLQPESVTVHTDLEQVPTVTIKVIAAVKPASS